MLGLAPIVPSGQKLRVLAIGAHSDDIEIGCGGTILRLVEEVERLDVLWVVLSARDHREGEARASAAAFLGNAEHEIRCGGFRDAFFPHDPSVKEFYEELKSGVSPDIVFVHARTDLHQDHRVACELAWNTFRDHTILEYEVPKYDGDLGSPNVLVPLEERHVRRKVALLAEHFGSQRDKHWFTDDLFLSLMRLRGMEARSPTGYAEGFTGRKLRLDFAGDPA